MSQTTGSLFKNKKSKINKIFAVNSIFSTRYKITGDNYPLVDLDMNILKRMSKSIDNQALRSSNNRKANPNFEKKPSFKENEKPQKKPSIIEEKEKENKDLNINTDVNNNKIDINNNKNSQELVNSDTLKTKKVSNISVNNNSNNNNNNNIVSKNMHLDKSLRAGNDLLLELYEKGVSDPNSNKSQIKLTKFQKEKFGLEDNNPYIYTFDPKGMHPFCQFYDTNFEGAMRKEEGTLKYPEGRIINCDDYGAAPDYSLKGIYKGIKLVNDVGLVIVDPAVRKKYEGLVANIIFQLLKVPFGHHMCLQVKIFEPKALEERFTNVFSCANQHLIPASDPSLDTYERFKRVITFIMAGLYIPAQQLKPFNPYLGETFQGELPNGAKIYVEQVTHKPLCVRFYMFYEKVYKIYGYFNFDVRSEHLGQNMYVIQHGPCTVEFPELKESVTFNVPEIKIVNATSESGRANLYSGHMIFNDPKNRYKAYIVFNKNKKIFHQIFGCIYKFTFPKGYIFDHEKEWKNGEKLKLEKLKKSPDFLEEITGSWLTNMKIGDKEYWDIQKQIPEFIRPVSHPLPSDGRNREDLIWLYRNFYCAKNEEERQKYLDISQKWKVLQEDFNRWERKRRADYNEQLEKKKKKK